MKTITIDGVEYNLVPKTQGEPLICTLDGVQYFLGPQAPREMGWREAMDWIKSQGADYELPSREVLMVCFVKPEIRKHFDAGFYWSSSEFSSADAWGQNFGSGYQGYDGKAYTSYVRAVKSSVL